MLGNSLHRYNTIWKKTGIIEINAVTCYINNNIPHLDSYIIVIIFYSGV